MDDGLHAVGVHAVVFEQVNDVELVLDVLARVGYRKEEPLRMGVGVDVRPHYEVIFMGIDLQQKKIWMQSTSTASILKV